MFNIQGTHSAFAIAWLDVVSIGFKTFLSFSFSRHYAVGHEFLTSTSVFTRHLFQADIALLPCHFAKPKTVMCHAISASDHLQTSENIV